MKVAKRLLRAFRLPLLERGAMHFVAILAVLVIGVVAYAAYYVATHDDKPTSQQAQTTSGTAATYQSNNDLEQAATSLDQDETDTSLDPAQLDEDLNTLL